MQNETDEFDFPKLSDALRDGYAHRAAIPASLDHAIAAAARERFDRRRRLRLMARWGGGLATGLAAVIVIVISLNRSPASKSIVRGDVNGDSQFNMVDALALAKHIAAKDKLERAWDVNGDGVIDQRDVDAIAAAAVSLKQTGLAHRSLPKLHDLGIDHVGLASASGIPGEAITISLAKARPTQRAKTEVRQ
jgi:hypothetical protein